MLFAERLKFSTPRTTLVPAMPHISSANVSLKFSCDCVTGGAAEAAATVASAASAAMTYASRLSALWCMVFSSLPIRWMDAVAPGSPDRRPRSFVDGTALAARLVDRRQGQLTIGHRPAIPPDWPRLVAVEPAAHIDAVAEPVNRAGIPARLPGHHHDRRIGA